VSTAADGPRRPGRHGVLPAGRGRGRRRHRLDPAVHGRRLHLHRHGDRAPGATAGPLQLRPIADGDPGAAVRRRDDGADCRVRVRTEKSGGGGGKKNGQKNG